MKSALRHLALLGVLVSAAGSLYAAECTALKDLKLADTTLTAAEVVSGDLAIPKLDEPLKALPAFCRVTGVIKPTPDSEIKFEVWLPAEGWNGRLLGVGNGGFAGSISYRQMAGYLHRGYATAGTDAGHTGEAGDASWSLGHPEKVKDFGWRAVHLTTGLAKQLVSAYYGKPSSKAYFDACSDGGREALMEAQRFPEDYDGILAGAPANNWAHMVSSGVDVAQVVASPGGYISSAKLPAIQRASLAACDTLDGVKDGIVNDPAKCHFDPEVLLCKSEASGDANECLTQPQIKSLRKFYQGGVDSKGKSIFPGLAPGDETGWSDWVVGPKPGAGWGEWYVQNYFRYMVTADPKWNAQTANVDESLKQAIAKTGAELDATDPDLSKFAARGGKLIIYHGWNDPAISPWNSIAYYQSVQAKMGEAKASSVVQLYMAPGVEHCLAGPGPSAFGQLGIPTSGGSKFGLFDSLVDWVEKSTPPTSVIATKYQKAADGSNKVVMTRPLCQYPQVAKYNGTGDTNEAANFSCGKE